MANNDISRFKEFADAIENHLKNEYDVDQVTNDIRTLATSWGISVSLDDNLLVIIEKMHSYSVDNNMPITSEAITYRKSQYQKWIS